MAIKTSTFGGVTLSGKTAKAFKKQISKSKEHVNTAAAKSLREGQSMLKEYSKHGCVHIKNKK